MRAFNFKTPDEFKGVFSNNSQEITDAIVESISEAIKFQKDSADMFAISFGDEDLEYEITLAKEQFEVALTKCLDNYHKWEEDDLAIDTFLLLKEVKTWNTTEL
tara:strand:+ start:203 stop:514 length:312 start_codon:yes stop_codon:yes gene_type:complete